ncbi:MAG: Smr/MutS family protein [Rhodobacteraceae bacterium]|nr:Smr/MutS family protein [Paracoccaceae bacterium]
MTRRRRLLSPEDAQLWERLAATVRPLHPSLPAALALTLAPAPLPSLPPPAGGPALLPFRIGERAAGETATRVLPATEVPPPALDRRRLARLARGGARPEARLDLHGLTVAEAEPALTRFVLRSQAEGRRLVLVITGKGRAGGDGALAVPGRPGLLRRQVPVWLSTPPLALAVTGIAEAHLRHGGAGAFYVGLRRPRPGG